MSDPEPLPAVLARLGATVASVSLSASVRSSRSSARPRGLLTSLGLAVATTLACAATAGAASFTVDDATDAALETNGSTECVSTHGKSCTLRAAVEAADNTGGSSTIRLPAGEYKLTIPSAGADDPASGDLDVNGIGTALTIAGEDPSNTIINANHIDRAVAVQSGQRLTVQNVTIENGAQNGAAPSDESTAPGEGGAFYNDGNLKIVKSLLTGNSANGAGGVIYTDSAASSTTIEESTVTRCASRSEGGVLAVHSGTITLTGDTITHDSAGSDGGVLAADEEGGTEGAVKIQSSFLINNVAGSSGGALYVERVAGVTLGGDNLNYDSSDNAAGGAIYARDSLRLALSNSHFVGDTAGTGGGGAVYAENEPSVMDVPGSTFEDDTALNSNGGAIDVDQVGIWVHGSSFLGDEGDDGGALSIAGGELDRIEGSTFSDDDAVDSTGGAIYDADGFLKLESSTLASNNASDEGGAVYFLGSGLSFVASNDTFDGNRAGLQGGALDLAAPGADVVLLNDTIARGTAYEGGGIYEPENASVIENTIVADNVGGASEDGGGDCYGVAPTDNAGEADKGGNIDSDGSCFSDSTTEDHTGVDPLLGELAQNGGVAASGAETTDALLAGSPAIDAGVDLPEECPATDERGTMRTGSCDSGAYQLEPADVSVILEAPSSEKVGEPLSSWLTVENNGPAPATGITVTDTLPAGTYFNSATITGYFAEVDRLVCSGAATVTCAISGYLPSGDGIPILVTVIPRAVGTFTATAEVSASEEDPEMVNNTASAETTVAVNEQVERVETTKTVSSTQAVYVAVPSGVSGSTSTIEAPCRSGRSAAIGWRLPRGVHLRRIAVTRNGKTYKSLAGSARRLTVSMVGLPKGAVAVKVIGYAASGQRYAMTRTFHLCVAAKHTGGPSSDYLTKQ